MNLIRKQLCGWQRAASLALSVAIVTTNHVAAQEIYKVVDEDGNVTYTTEPPGEGHDTQVLDTLPEPSAEDVQAARERQQKISEDLAARNEAREEEARIQAQNDARAPATIVTSPAVIPVPVYRPDYYRPYYRPRPPHARPPHARPPYSRPRPLPAPRPRPRPLPYRPR